VLNGRCLQIIARENQRIAKRQIHIQAGNCTEVHAKRYMEADIQNARRQTCMQEVKETYRQRHEDTTADMKTWMLTKCRQTTELDACRQTNSQVGGENDRQTD
jgi:hypothetical protein